MEREIKQFSIWKHFKGHTALVLGVAKHTETNEDLVIYNCIGESNNGIYARPINMFLSEVDHEKYPNATQKYRFEKIQ